VSVVNFSITLPSRVSVETREVDVDLDDYQSLVILACDLLGETDCQFNVGGFGHDDWHLDVKYDLSSIMEQLPGVIHDLRAGRSCEIDLYGQGIERSLHFSFEDSWIDVECRSGTSWLPSPAVVRYGKDELIAKFENLAKDFAEALYIGVPSLGNLEPFIRWRERNI
jgi:hypothetical protein